MIQLDDKQLRKLQMIELEMLIEVDRICRKYNINYQIIGGTLLGSVRHGGFIPWDDDADVAMLRGEYEKFKKVCKQELDAQRFYFQDFEETKGYRWSYGKLRRKGTAFLREHQEHMPYAQGVFIDIFPVDGVPDNYVLRAIHNFHCFCIRKILWSEVGRLADKSAAKRLWFRCLSKIPSAFVFKHYKKMIVKSNRKKTKRVRIVLMPLPNKGFGYLRRWFEKSNDFLFEGKLLRGTALEKEFLTFEFGNYMKLPPENKRKVHPVSDIKLIDVKIDGVEK
ncbi:LicD family protein [Enterocloster bolteae]|uniref:LicD family protein n=1 Tax=Enterocloster bolteae TaxID=208479 RepID=UPI00189F894E|nr:LicD family protein [Enterocloster bolteae]